MASDRKAFLNPSSTEMVECYLVDYQPQTSWQTYQGVDVLFPVIFILDRNKTRQSGIERGIYRLLQITPRDITR